MKRQWISILAIGAGLLAACTGSTPGGPAAPPSTEEPAPLPFTPEMILEEKAIIGSLEASSPLDGRVPITINGDFRDGCYEMSHVESEVEAGNIVRLRVFTLHPEEAECTEALVPFTEQYVLDVSGLPYGLYVVDAYGTMTQFSIGESVSGAGVEGCPVPGEDETLVTEQGRLAAYCLVMPPGFTALDTGVEGIVSFVGPTMGEGPEPVRASLTILTVEPDELTLDEYVQAQIESFGAGLTPDEITLGGQRALVVVGLPGQMTNRQIFAEQGARIVQLIFGPLEPDTFPDATAEMELLYARVLETWVFLPLEE